MSVAATEHARHRYFERVSDLGDSVLAAWRDGEPFDVPSRAPVPSADEFRFDHEGDVVVCRREDVLATTYGLSPDSITNIYGVALAAVVDEEFGTDYRSGIDAENLYEIA